MTEVPYDQRIARRVVPLLARTPITPNALTLAAGALSLAAAGFFATGDPVSVHWGAGLFVLSRFLDHFDGELARLTGRTSRLGYYLDYAVGGASYAALFLGIGIGLSGGPLGAWAVSLGAAGAAAALIALLANLRRCERTPEPGDTTADYPRLDGFELEDGIYLLAPITWLGWLTPFFVLAGIGALAYCLWAMSRLRRPHA